MPELSWRQKNHDRAREYEKKYYYNVLRERFRKKTYNDRKCRLCEILMKSKYGGHGKKFYCDSCVESGEARRHTIRMAGRRFRIVHKDYYKNYFIKYASTT